MIQQIRVEVFTELDPAGAAGGNHRQGTAGVQTLEQLVALFQDGQVSSKVCVKDLVKAQAAQSGHHLSSKDAAGFRSQYFSELHPGGRRCLHYNMFLWISQGGPNLSCIVSFYNCPGRANKRTLTAGHALHVV